MCQGGVAMKTTAFIRVRWYSMRYLGGRESLSVRSDDAISDLPWLLVLPHPDYPPARSCQGGVDRLVACDVTGELRVPVVGVCSRDVAVLRAAMPEAPVDKDSKASAGEDNVWANEAPRDAEGKIDAEAQAAAMEFGAEGQLGSAIAPQVTPHALAHLGARGLWIGKGRHWQNPSMAPSMRCCRPALDGPPEAGCHAV